MIQPIGAGMSNVTSPDFSQKNRGPVSPPLPPLAGPETLLLQQPPADVIFPAARLAPASAGRAVSAGGMIMVRDRFDWEVITSDIRAQIPEAVGQAAVHAIAAFAGLGADDLVVELGVGAGQTAQGLCRLPIRFIGIDLSPVMLERSARRLAPLGDNRLLVQADFRMPWPVAGASARLVLGSRALHLMPARHLASEVRRVLRPPGGALVIARVERSPDGLHTAMKRRMNHLLRQAGHAPQDAGNLLEGLKAEQLGPFGRVEVGHWTYPLTPRQMIAGWEDRHGLAGCEVPAVEKQALLTALETWALDRFGDLDAAQTCRATYVLTTMRLSQDRD